MVIQLIIITQCWSPLLEISLSAIPTSFLDHVTTSANTATILMKDISELRECNTNIPPTSHTRLVRILHVLKVDGIYDESLISRTNERCQLSMSLYIANEALVFMN